MGKTLQRLFILLAFPAFAAGQCPDKVITISYDTLGCKQVVLSPDMWAYYYLADKNLQAIEDSIPKLSHDIEQERARNEEILAATEAQVQSAQAIIKLSEEGRQDCDQALVNIAVKNMRLTNKIKRKNKIIKGVGILGFVLGVILTSLISN